LGQSLIFVAYSREEPQFQGNPSTNPAEFELELLSLSKYFRNMSDEDRDYLNCAKTALEDQIEWKID
jgi:hypothetical protein